MARTRNFASIVYPDSAPSDWMDILEAQLIPAFVSPLHDKDTNPSGDPKKPHYHVILMFDSVKTIDQAKSIFALIGGVGCEVIQSIRGHSRYLCHLDKPEKYQYNPDEVRSFAGADYYAICSLAIDRYKVIQDMIDYCELYDVVSYRELLMYCRTDRFDWFRVLCDNGTYVIKEYLKSKKWEMDQFGKD